MTIKRLAFLLVGLSFVLTACSSNQEQNSDSFTSEDASKANRLYAQCMEKAGVPVEIHDGTVGYSAATTELMKKYDKFSEECWADLEEQGLIPASETPTEEDARESYELETKAYQCFEDLGYQQDPWPSFEAYKEQYLHPDKYKYSDESSYEAPYFKSITEDTVYPTEADQDKCWKLIGLE